MTSKPTAPSGRFATSTIHLQCLRNQSMNFTLYAPSTKIFFKRGKLPSILGPSSSALFASSTDAAVTTTNRNNPKVSTATWRLRPFTFFPPSYPTSPPMCVVLTLWLSIITRLGLSSLPACFRTCLTKSSLMRFHVPFFVHFLKYQYTVDLFGYS